MPLPCLFEASIGRRLKKDLRTAPAGSGVNSPPDSAPARKGDHAVALLRRATKLPNIDQCIARDLSLFHLDGNIVTTRGDATLWEP